MNQSLFLLSIVLGMFSGSLHAADPKIFDKWFTDTADDSSFIYAATLNDSGNLFGQYCFPGTGNCIYYLGTKTQCERESMYPVLANSDAGSAQLIIRCDGYVKSGFYRYVFTSFEEIDSFVRNSRRVGIAMPLEGDEFVVFRFELLGAITALEVMRARAESMPKPRSRTTRDQRL